MDTLARIASSLLVVYKKVFMLYLQELTCALEAGLLVNSRSKLIFFQPVEIC